MFDDPEDRLHGMFAQCVERSARLRLQAVCHLFDGVLALRGRRIRGETFKDRKVMDVSLHRQQRFDTMVMAGLDIAGTEVAGITQQVVRFSQRFRVTLPGRQ